MDNLTPEQRILNMQRIRSKNTIPEKTVAGELRKRRIYFRKNVKSIFGKPDIVFTRKKIAIFIDSDFWHGHQQRCKIPKSNTEYWQKKIQRNRNRDIEVNTYLEEKGWKVIRFWEYDIKKDLPTVVNTILEAISFK